MPIDARASIEAAVTVNACLAALAGFGRALSPQALGIFTRCGIVHLTLPTVDDACRYLDRVVPDVLVIDTHAPEFGRTKTAVTRLLKSVATSDHPPALVVLSSAVLTAATRQLYWTANASFVVHHQQTHRRLAALIRKLGGFATCCEPGSFHRTEISPLQQRHDL